MSEKLRKIIDIANQANHTDNVEIWTNSFKIKGKLYKDPERVVEGLVTLKDARLSSYFGVCECEPECECEPLCECEESSFSYEWFNVFEDQIIAFTALK